MSDVLTKFWAGLVGLVLLGLLWAGVPYIASAYHLDRGIRLLEDDAEPRVAIDHLETAVRLGQADAQAHRWLAKAYLQTGDLDKALMAADSALSLNPDNPLAELELGDVHDQRGEVEKAIARYEAWGGLGREERLLVNYLKLADGLWSEGAPEEAAAIWRDKVLENDPANLYASWRLYQYLSDEGAENETYLDWLTNVSYDGLRLSTDSELGDYQLRAIGNAVEDNLWSQDTKQYVLAYYVWRSDSLGAGAVLDRLSQLVPADPDVWYYVGENYRRQGQIDSAEAAFRKALETSPTYSLAFLRLGMLNQARFDEGGGLEKMEEAIRWYQQYHELAPGNPLGLAYLIEGCKLAGCYSDPWLQELRDDLSNRVPRFAINQPVGDRVLSGIDVDVDRLSRGEPTDLWLYWEGTTEATEGAAAAGVYVVGNQTVQVEREAWGARFPFTWHGPANTDARGLGKAAPPFVVQGMRGRFSFERVPTAGSDGVIRVTFPEGDGEDLPVVQFGPKCVVGESRWENVDEGMCDMLPGRLAVLFGQARLSQPSDKAALFLQDQADEWQRTEAEIEGTSWQWYGVAKPIRPGADEVWLGVHWMPPGTDEWLEMSPLYMVMVPSSPETAR